MANVKFDYDLFRGQFPHIKLGAMAELAGLWEVAQSFVGNEQTSKIPYDPEHGVYTRRTVLYLALAHLVQMRQLGAQGGLAGRVTSASEGSVNVSVEPFQANSLNAQWWCQTNEGALYWQLTAQYRLGGHWYFYREAHPY